MKDQIQSEIADLEAKYAALIQEGQQMQMALAQKQREGDGLFGAINAMKALLEKIPE